MKTYLKIFACILILFVLAGVISYPLMFAESHTKTTSEYVQTEVSDNKGHLVGLFKAEDGIIRFSKDNTVTIDVFGIEGTYNYHCNDDAYFISMGAGNGYLYYDDTSDTIQFAGLRYFRVHEHK